MLRYKSARVTTVSNVTLLAKTKYTTPDLGFRATSTTRSTSATSQTTGNGINGRFSARCNAQWIGRGFTIYLTFFNLPRPATATAAATATATV